MRHPDGACGDCGERLYGTADGGTFCPNCGNHHDAVTEETSDGESEPSEDVAEAS